ncbi:YdcF family protein [Candidatus Saccharibacteria bacterium]|nr:YdcF family protein [Candidatus Saccharibacteria bacterium]
MVKIITWILAFVGLVAVFIISTTLIISDKNRLAEICPNYKKGECSQKIDAVIAISGGNTALRTREAIEIFKSVEAKKLIFSGANSNPKILSDARQMANLARKQGVLEEEILLEEKAQNTHQNAQYTAKIIKQNGYKRIVLTTSKYHQARAKLEFEKALEGSGVEVISAPVSNDPDWSNLWWTNSRGW